MLAILNDFPLAFHNCTARISQKGDGMLAATQYRYRTRTSPVP